MEEYLFSLVSGAVTFTVNWASLGDGTDLPRASIFRTSGVREMHLRGKGLIQTRLQDARLGLRDVEPLLQRVSLTFAVRHRD